MMYLALEIFGRSSGEDGRSVLLTLLVGMIVGVEVVDGHFDVGWQFHNMAIWEILLANLLY
jgi:hypothetical protein